jgi:branched-chain amino acid transport system substrate-binding protein
VKARAAAPAMLIALVVTACQPASSPEVVVPPAGDILIGSTLPVTGFQDGAPPIERAIRLAIDEHPRVGPFKLAYWSLDDAVSQAPFVDKATQNVGRMIAEPRVVGIVGPYISATAFGLIPIANQASMVMISPTTTDACLTLAIPSCGSKASALRPSAPNNFFRVAPPEPWQGRAMARFAAQKLGVQWVAAINERGVDGDRYIDSFAEELARQGGGLVVRENVDKATTNFTPFLAKVKASGATAIYAVGGYRVCAARAQMTNLPGVWFLGTDNFTSEDCVKNALVNAADMYATYSETAPDYVSNPEARRVVAAYRKAFPDVPVADYTFAAYDCARILIDAIERVVQTNHGAFPTRAQVLAAVANTPQFQGLTGTYSFDSNGDAASPMMSIYRVDNGQWVYQQRIEAGP